MGLNSSNPARYWKQKKRLSPVKFTLELLGQSKALPSLKIRIDMMVYWLVAKGEGLERHYSIGGLNKG